MDFHNKTITLTFCDQGENHVGNQTVGEIAESGFALSDLKHAKQKFENAGYKCKLLKLHNLLPDIQTDSAYLLVIRNGVDCLTNKKSNALFTEQDILDVDKKAFMYGRVVNKHARHNLCFSDHSQEPDYEQKKGRIIAFDDVPLTNRIRKNLPKYFGEKALAMQAEGNYYYDINKCGIGYHGDAERRLVVGVRLGETLPLCYQWYHNNLPVGKNYKIQLQHGDCYAMSENAVGTNWKKSSIYTLRHAAGCDKYIKIDK